MNPLIRPEQPDDTTAIGDVLRSAFPTEQEAQLVERLRRNHRLLISLVAEVDGMVAGHIALNAIKIEGTTSSAGVGLAPLSVRPELQRRGLGAQPGS
jgi:putative acetyltransferase